MSYINGVKRQTGRQKPTPLGLQTSLSLSISLFHTHTHPKARLVFHCCTPDITGTKGRINPRQCFLLGTQPVRMAFRKTTFLLEISLAVSQFLQVNASDLYSEGVRSTYLIRLYVSETLQRISKYLFVASNKLQWLCRIKFPINHSFITAGIALVQRIATGWKIQGLKPYGASIFCVLTSSGASLSPKQPPIQWGLQSFPDLDHLPLIPVAPRIRMSGLRTALSWYAFVSWAGVSLSPTCTIH